MTLLYLTCKSPIPNWVYYPQITISNPQLGILCAIGNIFCQVCNIYINLYKYNITIFLSQVKWLSIYGCHYWSEGDCCFCSVTCRLEDARAGQQRNQGCKGWAREEPRLQVLGKGGAKTARDGQGRCQDRHCHGRGLRPNEAVPGPRLFQTGEVQF